jgi:uncharacterized protein involved in exopolysaccharide biosynthesis
LPARQYPGSALQGVRMELRQYLTVLKKWLWLILLVAVVAAGASYSATSRPV